MAQYYGQASLIVSPRRRSYRHHGHGPEASLMVELQPGTQRHKKHFAGASLAVRVSFPDRLPKQPPQIRAR